MVRHSVIRGQMQEQISTLTYLVEASFEPLKHHVAFHSQLPERPLVVPYYSSSSWDYCVSSSASSIHPISKIVLCSLEIDRRVVSRRYGFEYVLSDALDGGKPYRIEDICMVVASLVGRLRAFPRSSVASY